MGNEIEIKDLDLRGTDFLPTRIEDIDGIKDIYNLENEFAKTKKNRNLLLYLSILLFFAIVIGSAFAFSLYIQSKNKDVDINISEFEDLRLKEVIDSARSHENNLDLLQIKLEILKVERRKDILEVWKEYHQKELNLLAQSLPDKETDLGLARLRTAEQREVAAIDNRYSRQIKEKEEEIEAIKEEIKRKKEAEIAEKSESISNVDRLNALKMEELKKSNDSGVVALRQYYEGYITYLESLYNPVFQSPKIQSILAAKVSGHQGNIRGFEQIYEEEGIIARGEYLTARAKADNKQELLDRLARIPFKNSVVPSLTKIDQLTNAVENDYESMLKRFSPVIEYKNSLIANYRAALDHYLAEQSENGYIIDPSDSNNIHVHVSRIYQISRNMNALVFRNAEERIGEITFTQVGPDTRAKVVRLEKNKTIEPFDKILLKLN